MRLTTTRALCAGILAFASAASSGPSFAAGCTLGIMANLPVTMIDRRASVPVKVNGKDTNFWLDSGGFFSLMPQAKALELGLAMRPAPEGLTLIGIGGSASVQLVRIKDFGIVGQTLKNVEFLVGGSDSGNGLIGRNILAIADTEFDLANGSVKLIQPKGCEKADMAYWAAGKPYFTVPLLPSTEFRNNLFRMPVTINGVRIKADLDSGAPTSVITRQAAERAGIDLKAAGVIASDGHSGIGRRVLKGWVVPVASVGIGDEEILRTRLEVMDGSIIDGSTDMVLGADFMLAHHIYVSRDQNRIYFTYSGGKPFHVDQMLAADSLPVAPVDLPAGKTLVEAVNHPGAEPRTAEEFARRGNARRASRNYAGALADLDEAIRLSPQTANFYRDRANLHFEKGDKTSAAPDIDRALALGATDTELLTRRAAMRIAKKDFPGALADLETARKVTPPTSLAMFDVAVLLAEIGEAARAVPLYDPIIAAHEQDSKAAYLIHGRCWARALTNVDLDKALADCNRAFKRTGPRADFLDSRAMVYYRKGDLKSALADYDAALARVPKSGSSLYMRGVVKLALGQDEAGKADQAAGLKLDPDVADFMRVYGIGR